MHHPVTSRVLVIFCLVFAGEMIFSLPFQIPRFFRPTVLEVFAFSNAQLGDVFAVYGVTAMLAYFPGGVIADYFSARKLMIFSLLATAIGGFYMALIPTHLGLSLLYAYWGMTSILLFWAALIRATREWGGQFTQGQAFGLLDGGRGLVAAVSASLAVIILSLWLPDNASMITPAERRTALQSVIYFYIVLTVSASVFIWLLMPESQQVVSQSHAKPMARMGEVLRQPVIWLQAVIVICAYCGFKGLDNYALYAVQVLAMTEVEAAWFASMAAYMRPIAAVAAGLLADRFSARKIIVSLFFLLLMSDCVLSTFAPSTAHLSFIYANIALTFCAVYGLRGVYFALLEETKVTNHLTGTAVGLISIIGYTPDIFFGPIAGRLLDASPGIEGHHHFFLLLSGFMLVGLAATVILLCYNFRGHANTS